MALKEEVLGQFLGDETFPIEWTSETEKLLFWVFDDLHCPKPLSPMYEDIGGWWLSCDHMFRRFGTPFATDWIYKNVNGYLYTTAIPAEAGLVVDTQEYNYRTNPIVPEDDELRRQDRRLPRRSSCRSTATTSPTGGGRASSPRCSATSTTSRACSTGRRSSASPTWPSCSRTPSTCTTATGRSTGC